MIRLLPIRRLKINRLRSKNTQKSKIAGYTLIEVIVALAVFAIVSTMTGGIMLQAFDTKKRLAKQTEQLNELHVVLTLIRRDIAQITNRPIRGNENRLYPPFIGESNYTEFTRGGFVNPDNAAKSSMLQRVALLCGNHALKRRSWSSVDSPTRRDMRDQVLLEHIKRCTFAYISQSQEHLSSWRPYALSQKQKNAFIPIAIELSLTLENNGSIKLVFPIPEGMYAE